MKLNKILTFILVFVLMFTCVSINTLAEDNVDYLDLESTETYKDSKDLEQNYTFKQTGDVTYTDVTKVKLTWTINDIEATYTSHKTWDPTNLQWTEAKKDINVTHNGASFTLTNYSSNCVSGTVSFEAESALKDTLTSATFDDNNGKTIDTMVNADYTIDETKKTNVPSNTITASLEFNKDSFVDLTATTSATKYGTYTVTIKNAKLTQIAPAAPALDSKISISVTLKVLTTEGQGAIKYGYSTENDSSKVTNWQSSAKFGNLDPGTTYYFFTKYEGNKNYNAAVSDGTEISTDIGCILSSTLVTLADGTTKLIDDVTTKDQLMTFNFYNGSVDGNFPAYVLKHENKMSNVIIITLENDKTLQMCDWQEFFDMDARDYFDININNYKDAIGKNVMVIENGKSLSVKITNVTAETKVCTCYEIFTEYNKNFVANGVLTLEPETYLDGVYTIGEDFKIDSEQYEKDVATYGRYTYAEFAAIMSEDEFAKYNIADKKIAVGKGTITKQELFDLYREWLPIYRVSLF